ncbi:MAG: permease-like cell division protein FtsX [Bacteroidales bacterium]|nr:permease-like cell division protein FtsX [Bacteroidales bacterium]
MAKSKVNLWENRSSTILSITLVMFLLGLCMLVEYHSYRLTHDMQERITFKVDLEPEIEEAEAQAILTQIESLPYVKHVDYISRDEAAEIFSEDLNDDFVKFIGYNPLYPSMMVNLKIDYLPEGRQVEHATTIDQFTNDVSKIEKVTNVAYQESVVNEMNSIFYRVSWILIIFMVLLIIVSILMIRSTMSIVLYAQRDTIRTMQLVGAKSGFIARPFLKRSIWYGLLGAIIAILVLAIAVGTFNRTLGGFDLLNTTHMSWYGGIAAIIIILGIVLSYFSTLFTVNKYLHSRK